MTETKHGVDASFNDRLNILRAGVLGANDGIISIAGVVIGVASATSNLWIIFLSGLSAILAGAFSMAGGEYVSVDSKGYRRSRCESRTSPFGPRSKSCTRLPLRNLYSKWGMRNSCSNHDRAGLSQTPSQGLGGRKVWPRV